MRPIFVITVLFLALIVSVILFWVKHGTERTRFDNLIHAVSSIRKVVPLGGTILIKNQSNYWETDMQVMYAVAPIHVRQAGDKLPDSILYVRNVSDSNNRVPAMDSGYNRIWTAVDSNLHYSFFVKH